MRLHSLFAAGSVLALAIASPAFAQSAPANPAANVDDGAADDGEIIVTAQRREERLQDVPIAITAVNSEGLARRNVTDIQGLQGIVPGLSISGFAGANSSNVISIRGITGQSLGIGAGQAVAVYLDGVYLSRPDAAFFGLDDVERLEVLRGPQGTLYGRNATAGAINIITRDPGDRVEGGINLAYGNFNTVTAKGSIRGPLGGGFSAGLSGSYTRHDGYLRNTVTGNKLDDRESYTIRGKLRYASEDEAFSAVLAGDYSWDHSTPVLKNGVVGGVFVGMGNPKEVSYDVGSEKLIGRETDNYGVSLTVNGKISDNFELTSVSAYRKINVNTQYDADQSAAPALVASIANSSETVTQELRGSLDLDAFRLTAGANYFHEKASFGIGVFNPAATPFTNDPFDKTDMTAWALFAQAEYDLTEQLTLVGGLRYNSERRDYSIDYSKAPVPGPLFTGTIKDSKVIPSIGVNFKASSDVLLYAKVSNGYLAPGFNFLPGKTSQAANTFNAESLWAYEVGAKTQFLDRRATLNIAGFWYDYKDIQIRSTVGVGLTRVDNAAQARLRGLEGSLDFRVGGGFSIGAQATYLDATYTKFCQPISGGDPQAADPLCSAGLADRSGNRLNQAPKWSGGFTADYRGEIGDAGTLSANLSYSFSSSIFYLGAANEAQLASGEFHDLSGRIGFQLANGPELYVYGNNLTDKRYRSLTARIAPTSISQTINAPRTYGIGVRYSF